MACDRSGNRGLAGRAARLAEALRTRFGLQPGDRVALVTKNCPQYVECLLAIFWGGFTAVPANAKLHGQELNFILSNSDSKVAFATPAEAQAIDDYRPDGLEHLIEIVSPEYEALFAGDEAAMAETDADDLAWLFYTSGTTGRPKGAMISHRNLAAAAFGYLSDVNPVMPGTLIWGGVPMYVEDVKAALDRLGPCLAQIFGQGETPMTGTVLTRDVIADRNHPRWEERIDSAGVANSACRVRIGDADENPLPVGETGELLVSGDSVVKGYWKNDEATAATFRKGWLRTGDLAAMDDEGFVTLKDRSKDMIISGGSNIYPREVEEILLTHPGVSEVSVIGRPHADWGEVVVAYVVGEATPGDLDALCLEIIARFKRPKDYGHVGELPRNNYGKILKTELRVIDAKREKEA